MRSAVLGADVFRRLIFSLVIGLWASSAPAQLRYELPTEDIGGRIARISLEGGRYRIYASGTIQAGDAVRLRQFIRAQNVDMAVIAFDSPGGSVAEALRLGNLIRELNLDTEISRRGNESAVGQAVCASACAYAFAGGSNRYFTGYGSRLGIHQFSMPGTAQANVADVQVASAVLVEYLTRMGVDANAFAAAAVTRSEEMLWLSPEEAESLRLANNGNQVTTAEIRTVDMIPYLRLEQIRQWHWSRVLILCGTRGPVMMAGIVSSADEVPMLAASAVRSYLEVDGAELLVRQGTNDLRPEDGVLWLDRLLDAATAARIARATRLDYWVDGGGALRWGSMMDLRPVRQRLTAFLNDCYGSRRSSR